MRQSVRQTRGTAKTPPSIPAALLIACLAFPATAWSQSPSPAPAVPAGQRQPSSPQARAGEPDLEMPEGEDRWEQWLRDVELLIIRPERQLFLSLSEDYQREAFVEAFWRVRDPHPRTVRNELKERWPVRLAHVKSHWGGLHDDRARIYLVHGEPSSTMTVKCTQTRIPAEVWVYDGSEQVSFPFVLMFLRERTVGTARLWVPGRSTGLEQVAQAVRHCINGDRLQRVLAALRQDPDYPVVMKRVIAKPRPRSEEWIQVFEAYSTDLPEAAEPLAGALKLVFPGRHQLRTVVQGLVTVPADQVAVSEFAGYRSYDFLLVGEVLQDGSLFERFRYKFGFPEAQAPSVIPLSFQRYLRPGDYTFILKLSDLHSDRVYRVEEGVRVPPAAEVLETSFFQDERTERLFAEATEAIRLGETGLRLIPLQGELLTGFVRFDTLVSGNEIERVQFLLDDRPVLTRNRPPFNVRIDLGEIPRIHLLRAVALDAGDREVAHDEILINGGGYRFSVRLLEPRKGRRYVRSLRARAEVEVPEGRTLERVELYLNETLVATLFQEPFVQPILLPETEDLAYVRAVAYLPDGNTTEDTVFLNAPDFFEEMEVQLVELYTSVLDRRGRPVAGLTKADFRIEEDEVPQTIARFELVEDQSIHVGILIDNSASMAGTLEEVRKAALSFFDQAIRPKDRAAVITFNSFPHLAVELTSDRTALGSGLAGLVAEGQTALFDSVMFALYYFAGIKGQRAILVLSDGKDESSRFTFEETLEYARRAGITIYTIGLRLGDGSARNHLRQLADETGGRSFFIREIRELGEIYDQVQRELRSQYLIAYQSTNASEDPGFRSIDLRVRDEDSYIVRTLSGYYP